MIAYPRTADRSRWAGCPQVGGSHLWVAIAGSVAMSWGGSLPAIATTPPMQSSAPSVTVAGPWDGVINRAVDFVPPGDVAPRTSIGGGTRGSTRFVVPGDAMPTTSIGGGTRGATQFVAPGDVMPTTSIGGGSRGSVTFAPPGDRAPRNTSAAGSRGDVTFVPPGDASPTETNGGGSRAPELEAPPPPAPIQDQLVALLPPSRIGRTLAERPTFFIYLPKLGADRAFFSLQDEQGNHVYQVTLDVGNANGRIVAVTLPDSAAPLTTGVNYLWYFAPLAPGASLRPDTPGFNGWVRRVSPEEVELATPAGTATPQGVSSIETPIDRAAQYATQGIWYDTLAVLATAMQGSPANPELNEEWTSLLSQVGLAELAQHPLVYPTQQGPAIFQ